MKKTFNILIAFLIVASFGACNYDDDFTPPNFVTFEQGPLNVGVDLGGSTTREVTLYTGNVTSNDRTFNINVGSATTLEAAGYNVPSSVTVPGGSNEATFNVDISDVNLGLAGKTLVLQLQQESGLTVGAPLTMNISTTCVGREFVIDFEFDGYASELSWGIADAEGNMLITGGGYADGAERASRSLCLESGTYTFYVADAYGDGLTFPNVGSITLSYAGEVLAEIDGDYGEGTSVEVSF